MANIKEKVKNFWEDHKVDIITVGGIATVSIGAGVYVYKCYMSGFRYGVAVGFNTALDWLDENFPAEFKARELYEAWVKENPESVVWVNNFGKVVKK